MLFGIYAGSYSYVFSTDEANNAGDQDRQRCSRSFLPETLACMR